MSIKLLKKSIDIVEDNDTPVKLKKVIRHSVTNKASIHGKHSEKFAQKNSPFLRKSTSEMIERNIKQLLELSDPIITLKKIEKIVQHSQKTQTTTCPKQEKSIFTDEDFQRFDQEYFIS